jgi:hypothetical protein
LLRPTRNVHQSSKYDIGDVAAATRDKERGAAQTAPHLPCHAALRDFDAAGGFLAGANCSSSLPLRTAVINVSMTAGILSRRRHGNRGLSLLEFDWLPT